MNTTSGTASRKAFTAALFMEWRRFRRDGTQKMLLFVLAPLLSVVFCTLYVKGGVADIPVAIVDSDGSTLSRTLIRSIDATKSMNVVAHVTSAEELRRGIIRGDFDAGILFPRNMTADVKASRLSSVQLFCNGTKYLAAATVTREVQTIIKTFSAGILRTRLVRGGLPGRQATALVAPVTVDISYCWNPSMSYSDYLVPGLVFAQVGALLILSGALAFARERRYRTLRQLRSNGRASVHAVFIGKFAFYLPVIVLLCLAILFILFPVCRIGTTAGAARAFPLVVLFFIASWWFGAAVGSITAQPMLAASISAGLGIPSFLFSGWTFPLPAAPGLYAVIASVLPFTHFMPLWFGAMLKNEPFTSPVTSVLPLIVMTAAGYGIACIFSMIRTGSIANEGKLS